MTKKWLTWSSLSILGALPVLTVVACANANDNPTPATNNENKSVSKEVLGLEGTITDAKMIIDKSWIWNHLKELVDNSDEIKRMESIGDSINLKVSENDKTKGILTFFTLETKNLDGEILVGGIDKKYQVEISNFTEELDDIEKAFENAKNYINDNKYKIMGQLASEIKPSDISILKSELNLNFETKINELNYIDSNNLPNLHLGNNDEKGEKEIEIVLTRGLKESKFNYTITGLTTKKQKEFEKKISIDNYLSKIKRKRVLGSESFINDYLTVEQLEQKFLKPGVNGSTDSDLLENSLPSQYSLKLSNSKPVFSKEYGFAVIANAQIIEKATQEATSHRKIVIYNLELNPNTNNIGDGLTQTLLEGFVDVFPTKYWIIKRNVRYTKPSEIKSTGDLDQLLSTENLTEDSPSYSEKIFGDLINIKLLNLVIGGADDEEGYLKGQFEFKWQSYIFTGEKIVKTIRIYGFKMDVQKND